MARADDEKRKKENTKKQNVNKIDNFFCLSIINYNNKFLIFNFETKSPSFASWRTLSPLTKGRLFGLGPLLSKGADARSELGDFVLILVISHWKLEI